MHSAYRRKDLKIKLFTYLRERYLSTVECEKLNHIKRFLTYGVIIYGSSHLKTSKLQLHQHYEYCYTDDTEIRQDGRLD